MPNQQIRLESYEEELLALRRHFHANPELSLEERETAAFVEKYLRELGLKPERVGGNGVVATIYAESGANCKTVAIRAEMDAVAVEEKTELPWKSRKNGVMHACGHDGILAVALILARLCAANPGNLSVNVKFIFQPAEENGKGTFLMLNGGVMENPHVDHMLLIHFVNDAPAGLEVQKRPSSATIGGVEIKIHGRSAHWCNSEQGVDSIAAAGKVLQVIEDINRTYRSELPFILGIGTISGGTMKNVIAEETRLEGSLRACGKEDYFRLRSLLLERLAELERVCGVRMEANVDDQPIPPLVSDGGMVDWAVETGRKIWGGDCRLTEKHHLSGDSASFYFDRARGIFLVFTAEKQGEVSHSLHNGKFDFDERVMLQTVEFLFDYLQKISESV